MYFLRRFNERFRREVKGIAPDAMAALTGYDFPGNVRELENLLERAFALGARDEIERANLPDLSAKPDAPPVAVDDALPTLDQAERDLIARARSHRPHAVPSHQEIRPRLGHRQPETVKSVIARRSARGRARATSRFQSHDALWH